MTRHIVLSKRQQQLAQSLIDSGRFKSIDEVIGEGLRLVAAHQPADEEKRSALRAALQVGLDDLEQHQFVKLANSEDLKVHLDNLFTDVVVVPFD